jgi:hypothetical protein
VTCAGHVLELRDGDVVLVGGDLTKANAKALAEALDDAAIHDVKVFFVATTMPATVLRKEFR